jgi:phosphinothricin acetyltransferase
MIKFEPLEEKHRKAVMDIFNYYIRNTNYAYRQEEVTYSHFDTYLENAKRLCGYAVIDDTNIIIGLCQLKSHDPVHTFDQTVEVTYFLESHSTRKGTGTLILKKLLEDAKRLKKKQMIAFYIGRQYCKSEFSQKARFY